MPHLIVLAKEPRPGTVKTRLARSVGDGVAARLYEAFLADTLSACEEACRIAGARLCISFSPASAADYFGELAPHAVLLPQPDGDLGARLGAAAETVLGLGAQGVVLVGSDLPYLDSADLVHALRTVSEGRAIVGPSMDGGYWLLGLPRAAPAVFEGIEWSSEHVLGQTLERLEDEDFELVQLATHFDVDDETDIERLRALLGELPLERCPRTRAALL